MRFQLKLIKRELLEPYRIGAAFMEQVNRLIRKSDHTQLDRLCLLWRTLSGRLVLVVHHGKTD
jgi:hypothetical protein